eukprot:COSAG02_NODE_25872_length_646_cov_2.742230_1_plen_54_part_00
MDEGARARGRGESPVAATTDVADRGHRAAPDRGWTHARAILDIVLDYSYLGTM